jgi:hypothetical protein
LRIFFWKEKFPTKAPERIHGRGNEKAKGKVVGVEKNTEGEPEISEIQITLEKLCISGRAQDECGLPKTHIEFSPTRTNIEIDLPM